MLSVQKNIFLSSTLSAEDTNDDSRTLNVAPINSNRGMLVTFNGATLDFEATNRVHGGWFSYSVLRYATVA